MSPKLKKKLYRKFPSLLGRNGSSLIDKDITCADGWYSLIHSFLSMAECDIMFSSKKRHCRITQIKEKFGRLCIHMNTDSDDVIKYRAMVYFLSGVTCEDCGLFSVDEVKETTGSWIRCLCPNCHQKSIK
jgi:hypothetical protein